MSLWSRLIERQILKARAEGQLDDLEGAGRPLPDHSEAPFVDAGTAAGYRIMAQAGAIPEEITLRKQIAATKAELSKIVDPDARKAKMGELADLMLRHDIAREARKKFMS